MSPTSAMRVNDEASAAVHYNNLIDDLRTHVHTGGDGGTVSHADLIDGVISGTTCDAPWRVRKR